MAEEVKESVRVTELRAALADSIEHMEDTNAALSAADGDEESIASLNEAFEKAEAEVIRCRENLARELRIAKQRESIPFPGETREVPKEEKSGQRPSVRAGREHLTYERNRGSSFFADLYAATTRGNYVAAERLHRHQREMQVERRDLSSTDGAGGEFVPPLWMMSEWVELARAGRPFANAVRNLPLPGGSDSFNIPKVLTGAAVAAQADLGAVQETDPTTGSVAVAVKTIAGMVDVSRQLLERSNPGVDEIIFGDLARDYATKLDVQALNGSGAGANARGVLQDSDRIEVTYTDASPTVGELYSKIADAIQQIHTSIYMSPTGIFMHPRRWAWITAALDTTGRPLVPPDSAVNAAATFENVAPENRVGSLQGLPVFVDASIPTNTGAGTNEDTIIVARLDNLYLWEDGSPKTRVFEEVLSGNLAVRLQLYNYFAFTSQRLSTSVATITGTGTIAPTF